MTERRQKWTKGAVVSISLGDGYLGFAQMPDEPEYAFFDLRKPNEMLPTPEQVVAEPVIFRLWVMRCAHSKGRWLKTGVAPIGPELAKKVLRFNQDPLKPSSIFLSYDGVSGTPCDADECRQIERAAVGDPEHVEDRLRDYFAGRPNKWVESLRVRSTA
jgi:hypothetical protein